MNDLCPFRKWTYAGASPYSPLAAREPLPVEILQRLFYWQDEELRDFTRTLGSAEREPHENNSQYG